MKTTSPSSTEKESKLGRIGYRPFWVLLLSILIRAVHQIGAAVFLGVFLLGEPHSIPQIYMMMIALSGTALLLTEWMRHRQLYRELSGISTFIKLLLIGLAYHQFLPQTTTIITAFALASISSHAPRIYRHRLLY